MKIFMCDVCKKVHLPDETTSIQIKLSSKDFVYKNDADDYNSFCHGEEIIKDVCHDCAVSILKLFYPQRQILTKEETKELQKR